MSSFMNFHFDYSAMCLLLQLLLKTSPSVAAVYEQYSEGQGVQPKDRVRLYHSK